MKNCDFVERCKDLRTPTLLGEKFPTEVRLETLTVSLLNASVYLFVVLILRFMVIPCAGPSKINLNKDYPPPPPKKIFF